LVCTRKNQNVTFRTSNGIFKVELYGKDNPVTVNNFVENIEKDIYKNKKFYKIISYPELKIIHSGIHNEKKSFDIQNYDINKQNAAIPLEIKLKREIEPRYKYQINNPSEISNLSYLFEKGSIAMVKKGNMTSSSTEFFFVTNKFPELDGRYAIFGKVISGFKNMEKLNNKDFIYEIIINP